MFEIGDKIIIRSDLAMIGERGGFEHGVGYNEDMDEFAGRTMTIASVHKRENGLVYYRCEEDYGDWMWSEDMLTTSSEKKEEQTMYTVEHKAVEQIDREQIMREMYDTLEICDIYHPTDKGLNTILDKWEAEKGRADICKGNSVLDLLSKHPDYVPEKGYIVKKNEYDRGVDINVITDVLNHIDYIVRNPIEAGLIDEIEIRPWSYRECKLYKEKLNDIFNAMCVCVDDYFSYRGMTKEEVRRERDVWDSRLYTLQSNYIIANNRCYSREDRERFENIGIMMDKITSHIRTVINGLSEEELIQPLLIDEQIVEYIEASELNIRGVRVGQKFNKVINKILTETGIKDKWIEYNRQIARLGDAASPTKFTRFTIISANPIDFWRMSFGSSWSSCHTIDKEGYYRPSEGGDGYEGMHASGTESYMLDSSSVVMYTVDKSYEGNDYELEPKINRCMFHIGEEKFIMGRVYPQGTDGAEEVYRQWRQIFQQIMAECLGTPNYWKTEKDRGEKFNQIQSYGTHYRDYEMDYCNIAGWSYLKPTADATPSTRKIKIGATPICPCCGREHWVDDNIECDSCNDYGVKVCHNCGYDGNIENMHEIDGEWYCEDCCFWCEYHEEWEVGECFYVDGYGDVCEYAIDNGDFAYCEQCGEYSYVGNYDDGITTESGEWYCCERCAERAGYVQCEDELWYPKDEVHYCDQCECYVTDESWDEDAGMCVDCVDVDEDRETA